MQISNNQRGDVLVCAISGNITGADCDMLVRHAGIAECKNKTALDLSRIDYMDSSGLGAIVRIIRDYRQLHTPLALVDPSPFVARTLQMTRLDKMVPIAGSVSEAICLLAGA